MIHVGTITTFLQRWAPIDLAEPWDNVGLLVGDPHQEVRKVMCCLTITPASVDEAIQDSADLIVSHHPCPFEAIRRLTRETHVGAMLLDLAAAEIAVFSPHTAFDSAPQGINQRLAEGLQLRGIAPIRPSETEQGGTGRWGWLDQDVSLLELAEALKAFLKLDHLHYVGDLRQRVRTVATACGAAGELVADAIGLGCDTLIVGEARFHTLLEAEAAGLGLLLPGHFASERFAVEALVDVIAAEFPNVDIWASRHEHDPIGWL